MLHQESYSNMDRGMGCISKLQTNSIPDVTLNVKV